MISAGRVLIKPCGEWKAETTYYMLDLVNYKGYAYLAKRTVVGIEPSADTNYWHNMLDINKVIEEGISGTLAEDVGKLLEERFAELLSEARYVTDLFADFDVPTFVRWDTNTSNTPYTEGLTSCYEGYALVFGKYDTNHTISAWAKGGIRNNCFMHTVSGERNYGWDSSISASGGTMTGNLILNADPESDLQAATKKYVDNSIADNPTLESYFAFCANANEASILCALGKNNEDRIKRLGLQLAMYAWFCGDNKTEYPFTELVKCNTLADIPKNDSAYIEVCFNDKLREFLFYNEYAKSKIWHSDILIDNESTENGVTSVKEIDFEVTQEMLDGEDFVFIDYEVSAQNNASAYLYFNEIQIARAFIADYSQYKVERKAEILNFKDYNITSPGVYKFKSETVGYNNTDLPDIGRVRLSKHVNKK